MGNISVINNFSVKIPQSDLVKFPIVDLNRYIRRHFLGTTIARPLKIVNSENFPPIFTCSPVIKLRHDQTNIKISRFLL